MALYLQGSPGATPATVASALINNASLNKVSSPGTGSPNRLLYMAFIGGGGGNQAPTASFTSSCSGLTCNFTDTSTDSDGTIASRSWNFGDGGTSTATNPSHTYAASGTYTVSLTVTDNGGLTGSTSRSVSVSSGGGGSCGADPNTSVPNLTNGVWTSGTSASTTARWKDYKICVPSGRPNLVSTLDGTAGDIDLYVRFNALPTTVSYNCRGISSTPDETCTVTNPSNGWWYVSVYTYNSAGANTAFQIKATS
jgi:xanthomonalisin